MLAFLKKISGGANFEQFENAVTRKILYTMLPNQQEYEVRFSFKRHLARDIPRSLLVKAIQSSDEKIDIKEIRNLGLHAVRIPLTRHTRRPLPRNIEDILF